MEKKIFVQFFANFFCTEYRIYEKSKSMHEYQVALLDYFADFAKYTKP